MTLEEFLGPFEAQFDVPDDEAFVFDYETLPDPPETLTTGALVICKAVRLFNNFARIDGLWFYGTQQTYRLLGLLILATLFSRKRQKTVLSLTHPETSIRQLIVESPWPDKSRLGSAGLNMVPHDFEYSPGAVKRYPWVEHGLAPREMPRFALTAIGRPPITVEDWEARDVVKGFGVPEATARLARLLLDVSQPGCPVKEIGLEGELGPRGVAPGSAEVRFWLPGSNGWLPEYGLD